MCIINILSHNISVQTIIILISDLISPKKIISTNYQTNGRTQEDENRNHQWLAQKRLQERRPWKSCVVTQTFQCINHSH